MALSVGDPDTWAIADPIDAALSGPFTVVGNLFGMVVTMRDQDQFIQRYPTPWTYPVRPTARLLTLVANDSNTRLNGSSNVEAFGCVNRTVLQDFANEVKISENYRGLLLHDTAYPIEKVFSFQVKDLMPGPDFDWPHTIRNTYWPIVSQNVTLNRS